MRQEGMVAYLKAGYRRYLIAPSHFASQPFRRTYGTAAWLATTI